MKYLFLGLLFEKAREEEYLKKSNIGLQNAVNIFQWNLIDGMLENGADISIVNVLPVGAFPKQYKECFLKSRTWNHKGANCFECGSINLPFFKQWSRTIKLYRQVKKWLKANKDEEKAIIAYSYYLPFLEVLSKVSRSKSAETALIVPDLPSHFGILPKNKLKAFVVNSYGKKALKFSEYIDNFVFFTEHMPKALGLESKKQVVVEGICPVIPEPGEQDSETGKRIVFYSGTLNRKFGICTLLEAFTQMENENSELWICGSGEAEKEIESYAKNDKRITYWGYCSYEKVCELRSKATVLVNPRTNEGEYTKYSFPSKTFEYMASGIPTVMYKLDGIPDEYDPYLLYVEGAGKEALREKLEQVCKMDDTERRTFGMRAREFVTTQKTAKKQAQKVIELLTERSNM